MLQVQADLVFTTEGSGVLGVLQGLDSGWLDKRFNFLRVLSHISVNLDQGGSHDGLHNTLLV